MNQLRTRRGLALSGTALFIGVFGLLSVEWKSTPVVSIDKTEQRLEGGRAVLRIDLGPGADPQTLAVSLGGEDVTSNFRLASGGAVGHVEAVDRGENLLEVSVRDRDGTPHESQVRLYQAPAPPTPDMGQAQEVIRRVLHERQAISKRPNAGRDLAEAVDGALDLIDLLQVAELEGKDAEGQRMQLADLAKSVEAKRTRVREQYAELVRKLERIRLTGSDGGAQKLVEDARAREGKILAAVDEFETLLGDAAQASGPDLDSLRQRLAALVASPHERPPPAPPFVHPLPDAAPAIHPLESHFHDAALEEGGDSWLAGRGGEPEELLREANLGPEDAGPLLAGFRVRENTAEAAVGTYDLLPSTGVRFDINDPDDVIVRRAAELGHDPVAIYEFVRNEVEFEMYGGLTRGATATLLGMRGNNPDQVALLVALLRASGYRARFVVGDVIADVDDVQSWLQVDRVSAIDGLMQYYLPKPQRENQTAVLYEHWWAKVEVPYGAEQGRDVSAPLRWLFLDPSFKQHERHDTEQLPYQPIQFGFTGPGYLEKVQSKTLAEYHADVQRERLAPLGKGLSAVSIRGPIIKEEFGALPSTLPYSALVYHVEFSDVDDLPDEPLDPGVSGSIDRKDLLRPQLRVSAELLAVPPFGFLSQTYAMADIAHRKLSFGWKPAGPTAQAQLDLLCNGDLTQCSGAESIALQLVLYLDGVEQADSGIYSYTFQSPSLSLKASSTHALHQNLFGASATPQVIAEGLFPGEPAVVVLDVGQGSRDLTHTEITRLLEAYEVVGAEHPGASAPDPQNPRFDMDPDDHRALIDGLLQLAGVRYIEYVRDDIELMSNLEKGAIVASMVGSSKARSQVRFFGGSAVSVVPEGLIFSAPYYALGVYVGEQTSAPEGFVEDLVRYATIGLSGLEHRVWEELTQYEAISTVKGLQWLRETQPPGINLFQADVSALPAGVDPIAASTMLSLFPGHLITGHTGKIDYNGWQGYVFFAENFSGTTSTGAIISGSSLAYGGAGTGLQLNQVSFTDTPALIGQGEASVRHADPVNVVSGNLDYSETDFESVGLGDLPLRLARTYNSQAQHDGPFGYGWSHTYDIYLEAIDDNANGQADPADRDGVASGLALVDGTGSRRRFAYVSGGANGPFEPEALEHRRLEWIAGELVLTTKQAQRYHFPGYIGPSPAVGDRVYLTKIIDRQGIETRLHYDTAPPQLRIEDVSLGRELVLRYDEPGGHIVALDDWSGRTWVYEYAGDDLIRFTHPADAALSRVTQTYDYYTNQLQVHNDHNLKRVENALGEGMTYFYYVNDKTYKVVDDEGAETRYLYDIFRFETTVIDALDRRLFYRFDKTGRVQKTILPDGNAKSYVYDPTTGGLAEITDPLGGKTLRSYDAHGNLKTEQLPGQPPVSFIYWYEENAGTFEDPRFHRLVQVTDARGEVRRFGYTATGDLEHEWVDVEVGPGVDLRDFREVEFDAQNRVSRITEHVGDYPAWALPASEQPRERVTEYFYDEANPQHLVRVEDESGGVTRLLWDVDLGEPDRDQVRETRARREAEYPDGTSQSMELVSQNEYDLLGRPTLSRSPSGAERIVGYDEAGRPASETQRARDGEGNLVDRVVTSTYDRAGRPVSVTDPMGQIARRSYDLMGNLVKEVDRTGRAVRYRYDERDRIVRQSGPGEVSLETVYDDLGRAVEVSDAYGYSTLRTYDAVGRVLTEMDPDGVTVEYAYDANGNRIGIRNGRLLAAEIPGNADGFSTTLEYDTLNRPVVRRDALGQETRWTRDLLGNPYEIQNARGHTTQQDFDARGRLVRRENPLLQAETYTYDSLGNLIAVAEPNGFVRDYRYDLANLEVTIQYDGGDGGPPERVDRFGFDGFGNRVLDASNDVTYYNAYDPLGRLTRRIDPRFQLAQHYTYDAEGRMLSETGGDGGVTQYRYNAMGRLSATSTPDGTEISRHYDAMGRVVSEYYSTGAATFSQYTHAGRLYQRVFNSNAGQVITGYGFSYDPNGRLRVVGERPLGNPALDVETEHWYDGVGQVKQVRYPDQSIQSFEYDAVGNRVHEDNRGVHRWYQHDAANRLLGIDDQETAGTRLESFAYDASGNRTSWQVHATGRSHTYTYDERGRLQRVEDDQSQNWWYQYDAFGQRIRSQAPEGTQDFAWSRGNRTEIYEASTLHSRATFGPGLDDLQALYQDGITHYVQRDGLGNVVGIGDPAGAQLASYGYDAFGTPRTSSGSHDNRVGYQSRVADSNGLMYYRQRYYDPGTGRFLSEDPIHYRGGINFYAFVRNDPANLLDPLGLKGTQGSEVEGQGAPGGGSQGGQAPATFFQFVLPNTFSGPRPATAEGNARNLTKQLDETNAQLEDAQSRFYGMTNEAAIMDRLARDLRHAENPDLPGFDQANQAGKLFENVLIPWAARQPDEVEEDVEALVRRLRVLQLQLDNLRRKK